MAAKDVLVRLRKSKPSALVQCDDEDARLGGDYDGCLRQGFGGGWFGSVCTSSYLLGLGAVSRLEKKEGKGKGPFCTNVVVWGSG